MIGRPEIVCICGSARFMTQMREANRELTFAGAAGKPVSFTEPG